MNPHITVRIDNGSTVANLSALEKRQLPFATARAITQTGFDFQKAERAHFADAFTLRRQSFIEREGVKLFGGIATKGKPSITFGVSDKASFLAKFETGATKLPQRAKALELPVDVRRNKRDIITRSNRPRQLLNKSNVFKLDVQTGKLPAGIYQRMANRRLKLLFAAEPQAKTPKILEFVSTMQKTVQDRWRENFANALRDAVRTAR